MDNSILVLINYLHENINNTEKIEAFKKAVISELGQEFQGYDFGLQVTDCRSQELSA